MPEMWWRSRNACALLVGMQIGATAVEEGTVAPPNVNNRIAIPPSNSTLGYIPERMGSGD